MASNILPFKFGQADVRALQDESGEPWFVAKDVCEVLGFEHAPHAMRMLDEDEKGVRNMDTLGGKQNLTIINESGLYSLILRSRKTEAKRFKKWVTAEVLPSIRKHGMYATAQTVENMLSDPETAIKMLQTIKDERARNQELEAERDRLKPKAETMDALMATDTALPIGSVAKALHKDFGIGRNRLFRFLRDNGILMANNEPKQVYLDRGYFRVVERRYEVNGEMKVGTQTLVYQKGVNYIAKLLRDEIDYAA